MKNIAKCDIIKEDKFNCGDRMNFTLNIGEWNNVFAVPASVVDSYIKLAGGNSLKLLLFLLRHGGETFSADYLKQALGFLEKGELEDAALFWVQRGIIRYDKDDEELLVPAKEKNTVRNPVRKPEKSEQLTLDDIEKAAVKPAASGIVKIAPTSVSSGEIARRINEDKKIEYLFRQAEILNGKPLLQRENQTVIALVDHFGLPAEVALLLLKFCYNANKTSPGYITAVAQDWSDNEIKTIELADSKIRSLEKMNALEKRICEALELKTALTKKQREFLKKWSEGWSFSEEMIILAITKTINQIGQWKVPYTDKILENWKADDVFTPEAAESDGKNTVSKTESSFDPNDIMAQIMKKNYS